MSEAWLNPNGVVPMIAGTILAVGLLGLFGPALLARRQRAAAAVVFLGGFAAAAYAAGAPAPVWVAPLAVAVACGLTLPLSPAVVRRAADWIGRPAFAWAGLLGTGLVLAGWSATAGPPTSETAAAPGRTDSADPDEQARRRRAMAALTRVESPVARTDKGRRVGLFVIPESALNPAWLRRIEAEMARDFGPNLQLIRTGPPDGRSDCHGWVFANNEWWVGGEDVELILEDNGYQPVSPPRVGDVVVYRDGSGVIMHTGLVSAATPGGPLLVESKWSWLGTYLHPPEAQPYGGQPVYYRSSRKGHRLAIAPPSPAALATQP